MEPPANSWADLPGDLLASIARRLDEDPLDLMRYGSVWGSAAVKYNRDGLPRRPKSMIPWLIIKEPGNLSTSFRFFRLVDKKTYLIHLPEPAAAATAAADAHFFRSSLGYLITVDRDANLHVTNPITQIHYALPPTHTIPDIHIASRDPLTGHAAYFTKSYEMGGRDFSMKNDAYTFRNTYFRNVAVAPPSSWTASTPSSLIVAASLSGMESILAIARPGDASWTPLPGADVAFCVMFHKERLFATLRNKDVTLVYDPDRPADMPMRLKDAGFKLAPDNQRVLEQRYLVESLDGNELFLVIRRADYSRGKMRTIGFVVYHLVMLAGTECMWLDVKNLGDFTILLASSLFSNCSVLVSSSGCEPHIAVEGNCIYFNQGGEGGLAVFHLEDGSISSHDSDLCGQWTPRSLFTGKCYQFYPARGKPS